MLYVVAKSLIWLLVAAPSTVEPVPNRKNWEPAQLLAPTPYFQKMINNASSPTADDNLLSESTYLKKSVMFPNISSLFLVSILIRMCSFCDSVRIRANIQ